MNPSVIREQEQRAIAYLRDRLAERAPDYVRLEGEYDERPLDGEGRTFLFSFDLAPGPGMAECELSPQQRRHYVAVGETEPNYFPSYGLHADDAYSFHVGTRFMLVMGVQRVDNTLEPPGARAALDRFVAGYAQGAAPGPIELAGLFRSDEDYFAVYRLEIAGRAYYCLGADCPPGFYPLTQHPPQTTLRLHLGKVIRSEAADERRRAAERPPGQ
jgi:hypothetical protein